MTNTNQELALMMRNGNQVVASVHGNTPRVITIREYFEEDGEQQVVIDNNGYGISLEDIEFFRDVPVDQKFLYVVMGQADADTRMNCYDRDVAVFFTPDEAMARCEELEAELESSRRWENEFDSYTVEVVRMGGAN